MAKRSSGGEAPAVEPGSEPAVEDGGAYGSYPTKRTSMVLHRNALQEMQYIAVASEANVSVPVRQAMDEWLAFHGDGRTR